MWQSTKRTYRRARRWLRAWLGLKPLICEPNVIVGTDSGSVVLSWMCGERVCRCGGTWERQS